MLFDILYINLLLLFIILVGRRKKKFKGKNKISEYIFRGFDIINGIG